MSSGQMRHDRIHELNAPAVIRTRDVTLHPLWLLWALLFTLILLLPFFLGLRPVSEYIGMTAPADKYSRIDFQWNIPDREAILKEVENRNFPVYQDIPRGVWMANVFSPVAALLEKAADLHDPGELQKYAQEQGIPLTLDESRTLTNYILKDLSNSLHTELLNPAQLTLEQWVFKRGVLSDKRYEAETQSPAHTIEILNPGNHLLHGRTIELGQENGPVSVTQAAALVDKAFLDRLWLLRSNVRQTLARLIARRIEPSLIYDPSLSTRIFEQRRKQALFRASHISSDSIILYKGERVTAETLQKLRAENETFTRNLGSLRLTGELVGKIILGFCIILAFCLSMLYSGRQKAIRPTALLALPVAGLAYVFLLGGIPLTLLPLGFLAGCVALGSGGIAGVLASATFCGFLYACCAQQPGVVLTGAISGAVFAVLAPRQRFRMGLAKAAIISGLTAAVLLFCWRLNVGEEIVLPHFNELLSLLGWENPLTQAIWILFSWLIAFVLVLLCMPFLQQLYRVTTNIRLQDLQEHPLLSMLLLEAPSTYYHSSVVSALSEAAAHAAGCNALLCKTACLYHDIGKLIKPEYFTENESGISRHDALTPQMSALIIISHVKDGVEMAQQWHLPQAITDIVSQHHGTTLVNFFLRQAREQAQDPDEVDEGLFRYPGPRPQFKEAAVCMIADSVEAASRSLGEATSARIRTLVHSIIIGKLEDRQFDESGLNFTDLARIEEALVRILISMFHSRVKYDNSGKTPRRR